MTDVNNVRYSGFWIRLFAYIIDTIVTLIPIAAVAVVFEKNESLVALLTLVIAWLYTALLTSSSWRATVGKKVLGLVIVDEYGERLSFGRASGRFLGEIISMLTCGIGYLMIAFTAHKQGLHDKIAKTFVIKKND